MNYFYNGILLPELPEVNTTTFPNDVYTVICKRRMADYDEYALWRLRSVPRVAGDKLDFPLLDTFYENYLCQVSDGSIGEWEKVSEGNPDSSENYICYMQDDGLIGISFHLAYTDFDVVDNGEVVFAGSEPVVVKYLYNGVKLPDINSVWPSEEMLSHAIIYLSESSGYCLTFAPQVRYVDEKIEFPKAEISYLYRNGVWELLADNFDEYYTSNEVFNLAEDCTLVWTSTDIYNTSNYTIYLAASEPVPVGGEPVQPEEPDVPVDPDNPDVPDTPDEPDEPDTPVEPDAPDVPAETVQGEQFGVYVNGKWHVFGGLPTVTGADKGKFLRVSDVGNWVAEALQDVSKEGM